MKAKINQEDAMQGYWNDRWINKETGWDVGYPSPAITTFFDGLADKSVSVLIPGCGNAYEAAHLVKAGFSNITLIDLAPQAVKNLEEKFAGCKEVNIVCGNFFQHEGMYDLIIEQTFFCAIDPSLRTAYVEKCYQLLRNGGSVAGLLFDKTFEKQGPPFGGSEDEYRKLFSPRFHMKMSPCYNSIEPRKGTELFIKFLKR